MNGITIGTKIFELLNKEIPELDGKIFPIVAEESVTYPFVVWEKTISPFYTKGIPVRALDDINVTIRVVSDKYYESANVASHIRDVMDEWKEPIGEGVQLCRCQTIDETFQDDAYVQVLQFNIKY